MNNTLLATALFCLLAVGCNSDRAEDASAQTQVGSDQQPAVTAQLHDAMCGCSIEGMAGCGNYINIDGEFVALEYPSLGSMEFCKDKKNGAKILVTGSMVDGKYVATTYERVE